tara:strand:+ start:37305 stop:38132 length:828 start_codon:yes stop_codon:yes gene_type:complete
MLKLFLLGLLFFTPCGWAEEAIVVKHYQYQERYEFGLKVLDLALSKLGEDYLIVGPNKQEVNEGRGELQVIEGQLDLEFMSATLNRESRMIPIKIPIYQGLLGLRLLLVKPALNEKIKKIEGIDELRQFVGGHGTHWGDLPVYAENDLNVVTSVNYDNLFEMLKKDRFDYFHRGVNEIWNELERYPNDFVVADNIMLYYPQPVYFYIGKHRPDLAKKLEQGLMAALADGSYKALFQDYYKRTISRANLGARKLIILKNPTVPSDSPPINLDWWMP